MLDFPVTLEEEFKLEVKPKNASGGSDYILKTFSGWVEKKTLFKNQTMCVYVCVEVQCALHLIGIVFTYRLFGKK